VYIDRYQQTKSNQELLKYKTKVCVEMLLFFYTFSSPKLPLSFFVSLPFFDQRQIM